eukprot:g1170.t1
MSVQKHCSGAVILESVSIRQGNTEDRVYLMAAYQEAQGLRQKEEEKKQAKKAKRERQKLGKVKSEAEEDDENEEEDELVRGKHATCCGTLRRSIRLSFKLFLLILAGLCVSAYLRKPSGRPIAWTQVLEDGLGEGHDLYEKHARPAMMRFARSSLARQLTDRADPYVKTVKETVQPFLNQARDVALPVFLTSCSNTARVLGAVRDQLNPYLIKTQQQLSPVLEQAQQQMAPYAAVVRAKVNPIVDKAWLVVLPVWTQAQQHAAAVWTQAALPVIVKAWDQTETFTTQVALPALHHGMEVAAQAWVKIAPMLQEARQKGLVLAQQSWSATQQATKQAYQVLAPSAAQAYTASLEFLRKTYSELLPIIQQGSESGMKWATRQTKATKQGLRKLWADAQSFWAKSAIEAVQAKYQELMKKN